MGDIGRQDTREGGHAIQQGEARRGTMGDKGRQDLGKTDAPSNKGKQEGVQWETKGDKTLKKAGHTIQQRETRRGTGYNGRQRGDKTFGKADTPSNTKADTLRKHFIRTPNSTLFGGKRGKTCENPQASLSNSVYLDCTLERISGFKGDLKWRVQMASLNEREGTKGNESISPSTLEFLTVDLDQIDPNCFEQTIFVYILCM